MARPPHLLVRLDQGTAAVIEVAGALEPDHLARLADLVRRTQAIAAAVVVDVSRADPPAAAAALVGDLADGRQGCAPFEVRGALAAAS